ncbi:ATP-binding protein [Hymenobacter ginsengisoli]|uniref:histidine kinase n=1 Tax=Hymenobacter ginsengisoli TaxID=1051626 RepID=A0ABP8QHW9_9BACT|nr:MULTISPECIES: ATP-binding protein [unclassified Hymenobacter]MBO2030074.1 GHKL domain-containing protein [Hymenobacter sp. BT559]
MAQQLPPDPAALTGIVAFQNLPAEVLAWLSEHGQICRYTDGETVVRAGEPASHMLGVLAGGLQYYRPDNGRNEPVFRVEAGRVTGILPYSRLQISKGQGLVIGETTLYLLPRTEFPALEQVSPELVQRLVGIMSDRARDEVRAQERDDKLRALGKLSAGLAHELNNPAAAIARASDTLGAMLQEKPVLLKNLLLACPPAEVVATLLSAGVADAAPAPRSALARADAEDELADWLETQGCEDGYALAPSLLDAGHTAATLEPLVAPLAAPARPAALAWLESHLAVVRLTRDIREASQRISTLVGNVKAYSHMDRAGGREPLDVATGLDSTLNIFDYALRQKNVQLTRTYAPDVPPVLASAGQLNQVWTNLIDNAIDALPASGGTLAVHTVKQPGGVCVSIIDNGSGLTPEVLAHMFEPFYTTKPAGEGSGLGLDIARRIVQEHGGRLEAQSVPGRTEFSVWLPAAS